MALNNMEKKGDIQDWRFSVIVNGVTLSQAVPQSNVRGGQLPTMNSIACQTHGSHKREIILTIISISSPGCQTEIQSLQRRNPTFPWPGLT